MCPFDHRFDGPDGVVGVVSVRNKVSHGEEEAITRLSPSVRSKESVEELKAMLTVELPRFLLLVHRLRGEL